MRKTKVFSVIIVALVLLCALVACQTTTPAGGDEDEATIVSIEVDGLTVPSTAYAGDFDVSVLRLNVYYSDATTETVSVTEGMIATADRTKLNQVGTYMISVIYGNCTTKFQITLLEKEGNKYTLRVYGGVPVKINGVDIDDPIVVSGDYYEAVYDEGTEVTVSWTEVAGYYFSYWTDNGEYVDSQSSTVVVMNATHTYRAYSEAVVNTVSFVTNCDTVIGARKTNVIYENDLPALTREGYVFDGWTETAVTGDQAIGSTAKKISFPFEVKVETILYATWRILGLEFDNYATATGRTGLIVADYTANDTELVIPSVYGGVEVVAISADAFNGATKLESVYIPATVEYIEEGFVKYCSGLKEIDVDMSSNYYASIDGILYNIDGDELIAYPAAKLDAVFSVEGVNTVASYAFYNAVVGGIALPSGLLKVGDGAFDSVHLDYVDFSQVNPMERDFYLGENLFNDNLTSILIDASYSSVYSGYFADYSAELTTNNADLSVIGSNGTLLYREIFNENSENPTTTLEIIGADRSLTSLNLPISIGYNVSSIGYKAFNGCINLVTFTIPNESRLERIQEGAFDGTPYLAAVTASSDPTITASVSVGTTRETILYKYYGNDETYVLSSAVTKIAEGAFRGNTTLKTLDISNNSDLKYIGAYAFYGCTSFEGVRADAQSDNSDYFKKWLATIGNYAFAYTRISSFSLAPNVESALQTIGEGAFAHCYYLTSVELGVNTANISADAFNYCYSLQQYTVPSGNPYFSVFGGVLYTVANGGYELFSYPAGRMTDVFDVGRPDGVTGITVTSIGAYAFFYSNIASVYIPASVNLIDTSSFVIPGLVGVVFEEIADGLTYEDMFLGRGAEMNFEPEYISAETYDDIKISTFFGNSSDLKSAKFVSNPNVYFVLADNAIVKIDGDELSQASVIRTARNAEELTFATDSVIVAGVAVPVTSLSAYSFIGYYLETLRLSEGSKIATIDGNALSYAFSLSNLYIEYDNAIGATAASFGEAFDNGLFVYVAENLKSAYRQNWGLSDKYLIDITIGKPAATFDYGDGSGVEGTTVYDTLTEENTPLPTRTGYVFGGWLDDEGNVVDYSGDGYTIPYNITLMASWVAKRYSIIVVVGTSATVKQTEWTATYGAGIAFEIPVYENPGKEFLYWRTLDGTVVNGTVEEWNMDVEDEIIYLYPVWREVSFRLTYDLGDGVTVEGDGYYDVTYGEIYTLSVPVREGYEFVGWIATVDGEEVLLTDADGACLLPWNLGASYTLTASWKARDGIKVSLYFADGVLYTETTVVYGEEFSFGYTDESGNKSALNADQITQSEWIAKIDLFCGWFDGYDSANGTGNGIRFTDENGDGLFLWNVAEDTALYAQWPFEVDSYAALTEILDSDMSRSVILTQDITVTSPIGSGDNAFSGIFNGAGHTVTFDYNGDGGDGYIGLFAVNEGTVKNFILNANITVAVAENALSGLYVGAIAAVNRGVITSAVSSDNCDVTASITVETSGVTASVGGLIGLNEGEMKGVGMNLTMSVTVNGEAYSSEVDTTLAGGTVVGTMAGGTIDAGGRSYRYSYSLPDDAFKSAFYGVLVGGVINVSVSSTLI